MRAVRLAVAVAMCGACLVPARATAQTTDGGPTLPVTTPDTRWASKGLHLGLAGSFLTLQTLDAISKLDALKSTAAPDGSRAVVSLVNRPAAVIAVDVVSAAVTLYTTRRLAREKPKTAAIVMIAMNAALGAVVAHNFSHGPVR